MFQVFAELDIMSYIRLLVETAVLTFVLYRIYLAISDTKATEIFVLLFTLAVAYLLFRVFRLDVLTLIIEKLTIPFLLLLCVFYHPELRRAFSSSFTRKSRFFRIGVQTTSEQIDSILNACNILVEKKRGALIVFPRHTDIQSILESGTKVNADLSSTLLLTIFDHDTPLHDGAAVVIGGRIAYAACYLPLSEQKGIKAVARLFGNDAKRLSDTDFFPIAMGIVLGVLFGKLNISFGSEFSFSPGLTGGVLIVALILSAIGKTGPVLWSMSAPANHLLRQLGLLLFLAEVGTSAGTTLVSTFQESGFLLFGLGAVITLVPMVLAALVGRFV